MSKDALFNYWSEALHAAFDEVGGLPNEMGTSDHETMVKVLLGARDQESMAFGYDCIPNPLEATVKEVRGLRAEDAQRFDEREEAWRKREEDLLDTICRLWDTIDELAENRHNRA